MVAAANQPIFASKSARFLPIFTAIFWRISMSRHGKRSTASARCGVNTWCSTQSSSARAVVLRWRPTSSAKCWNAWAKNHGIGCPKMMSQRKMRHPCMLLGENMTIWLFQSWKMRWCCWKIGLTTLYQALGRQTPSFFLKPGAVVPG